MKKKTRIIRIDEGMSCFFPGDVVAVSENIKK